MLRKFCLLALAACLLSLSAHAQSLTDQIDVFGGYSFMHYDSSPSFNTNGWELSGQYKVNPWLGGVVDVDGHYGNFEGVNSVLHDYLVGAQVSFPARVSPFAHVLVGAGHFGANGASDTSAAYGFGFGIDSTIAPQFAWRIIQLDVVHTHLFNQAENNTRIATGIVIHF
jgi:opacity protein-like surface antigen